MLSNNRYSVFNNYDSHELTNSSNSTDSSNYNLKKKNCELKKENKFQKKTTNDTNIFIKNEKKLLCNNIIISQCCKYGNKCKFAHSLSEQQMDLNKKKAFDMILSKSSLHNINLKQNFYLYNTLKILSKVCDNEHCTGGYNCKFGVCGKSNLKYQICEVDIEFGNCENKKCKLIHLTKKGLEPYNKNFEKINKIDILIKNTNDDSDSDISTISNDSDICVDEYDKSIFE
jgi:hypothetical protein